MANDSVGQTTYRIELWHTHWGPSHWCAFADGQFESEEEARQALEQAKDHWDKVRLVGIVETIVETCDGDLT